MPIEIINGPIISAGDSLSAGIDLTGKEVVRITMPANWTGANLTFQISSDGAFYNDLFDPAGNELTMVVVTGAAVVLGDAAVHIKKAAAFLKFRSGTRDHPVVQASQRDFALAVTPIV